MKIENVATDLIESFFDELNAVEIKYAVLRNYEGLPFENASKDVDILVNPKDYKVVIRLLKNVSKKLEYQLIWHNPLDYLTGFVFVKIVDGDVFSIKFDIFNGFLWRGCYYLDSDYILNNTMEYNGFKVPNKAHEAFIMIVYYVLYAKKIKTKYLIPIKENIANNQKKFEEIVEFTFNSKTAIKLLELVSEDRISDLVNLRPSIKNETLTKNVSLVGSLRFFKHIKTEYYNRWRFGSLLVFSGPDGAGKSILVTIIMELFHGLGIVGNQIPHHFLTSNIPALHKLPKAPKKLANQNYTKPYQAKSVSFVSSIIRVVYYYFAFLLDRLIFIKRELKGNQIVVFDRYYTDMIVDPSRIRIGLNKSIIQKIFKFLPSPNYTFIILANKELILKRKDELTEDKLNELLQEYSNLKNNFPNCFVLRNDKSISEGQLMLCKTVFDKLEERYR